MLVTAVPFVSSAQWGSKKSKSNTRSSTSYEFLIIKGLEIDFDRNNQSYDDRATGDEVTEETMKRLLNPKSQVMVSFDFGSVQNEENSKIMSQTGAMMSMADAVNLAASFGWRFVNSDVSSTETHTIHYYYFVKTKK